MCFSLEMQMHFAKIDNYCMFMPDAKLVEPYKPEVNYTPFSDPNAG